MIRLRCISSPPLLSSHWPYIFLSNPPTAFAFVLAPGYHLVSCLALKIQHESNSEWGLIWPPHCNVASQAFYHINFFFMVEYFSNSFYLLSIFASWSTLSHRIKTCFRPIDTSMHIFVIYKYDTYMSSAFPNTTYYSVSWYLSHEGMDGWIRMACTLGFFFLLFSPCTFHHFGQHY